MSEGLFPLQLTRDDSKYYWLSESVAQWLKDHGWNLKGRFWHAPRKGGPRCFRDKMIQYHPHWVAKWYIECRPEEEWIEYVDGDDYEKSRELESDSRRRHDRRDKQGPDGAGPGDDRDYDGSGEYGSYEQLRGY